MCYYEWVDYVNEWTKGTRILQRNQYLKKSFIIELKLEFLFFDQEDFEIIDIKIKGCSTLQINAMVSYCYR